MTPSTGSRATRPSRATSSTCSRRATQYVSNGNPSFWGGYVEAGYFLTGETRGYKAGAWDRTKVLKPFSKGGIGRVPGQSAASIISTSTRASCADGCTNNFVTGAQLHHLAATQAARAASSSASSPA